MFTSTGRSCFSLACEAKDLTSATRAVGLDLQQLAEMTHNLQNDINKLSMKQRMIHEVFGQNNKSMEQLLKTETQSLAARASNLRRRNTTIGARQEILDMKKQHLTREVDHANTMPVDPTLRMFF